MRILQVWNNNLLEQRFRECMLSVNSVCTVKGIDHTIVCRNEELFNDFNNKVLINFDEFIKDMDIEWWKNLMGFHQSQSDLVRMEFAKTTADLFYIDADVELLSMPEFVSNGLPYLGKNGNGIDFFIFYVNGNAKFFEVLLKTVQSEEHFPRSWNIFMKYFAFNYRVGGNNIKKVNIIPKDTYKRNWFK